MFKFYRQRFRFLCGVVTRKIEYVVRQTEWESDALFGSNGKLY